MTLVEIASLFEQRKLSVIEATGLGKDALHIYGGLMLFLLVVLGWRRRGGWVVAWFAVFVVACGGEWLDMMAELTRASVRPDAAHWHDVWNTMFWPTILILVGRWLPQRIKPRADAPAELSGEDAERRLEQA